MAGYSDDQARRMQSFYQPAYFGGKTQWSDILEGAGTPYQQAAQTPTHVGGFQQRIPEVGELSGWAQEQFDAASGVRGLGGQGWEDAYRQQYGAQPGAVQARERQAAYGGPAIGPANLQNYGVGQLQNYGVGALQHYGGGALNQVGPGSLIDERKRRGL